MANRIDFVVHSFHHFISNLWFGSGQKIVKVIFNRPNKCNERLELGLGLLPKLLFEKSLIPESPEFLVEVVEVVSSDGPKI